MTCESHVFTKSVPLEYCDLGKFGGEMKRIEKGGEGTQNLARTRIVTNTPELISPCPFNC